MNQSQPTGRARLAASVIIGRDDILFHRDHDTVEQVSGRLPVTPAELATWTDIIEARSRWCAERNIILRHLIVPEKHVVYADKLPGVAISHHRPAMQTLDALSAVARSQCLYPAETLITARQQYPTANRTDPHWTERGAFAVYGEVMRSLRREASFVPVTEDMIRFIEEPKLGDLGVRLEPERGEIAVCIRHKVKGPWRLVFENHGRSRGNTIMFESDVTSAPRLLVFRDSFFNYFISHVRTIFSKSLMISSLDMRYDVIETFKPDIIVFEMAERFLGYLSGPGRRALPADRTDVSFEDYSGVSLDMLTG